MLVFGMKWKGPQTFLEQQWLAGHQLSHGHGRSRYSRIVNSWANQLEGACPARVTVAGPKGHLSEVRAREAMSAHHPAGRRASPSAATRRQKLGEGEGFFKLR